MNYMKTKAKKSVLIRSVIRACDIMKCLSAATIGNDEIAKRTKLNKVTAHRLLKTLKYSGFVAQDYMTQEYFLGQEIIKLARQYFFGHRRLNIAAYQEMLQLRNLTGETVVIAIMSGMEKMSVLQVGSENPVRYSETAGFRSPLHMGAGGKILLAQFDNSDIELYFHSGNTMTKNRNTPSNLKKILEEIRTIRVEGYCTSSGEVIPSVAAIAVPIRNYIVPACLFIAGPEDRWKPKMRNFIKYTTKARDRIEKRLG
jgi:IclR family KDG regulon transcriptional repressor